MGAPQQRHRVVPGRAMFAQRPKKGAAAAPSVKVLANTPLAKRWFKARSHEEASIKTTTPQAWAESLDSTCSTCPSARTSLINEVAVTSGRAGVLLDEKALDTMSMRCHARFYAQADPEGALRGDMMFAPTLRTQDWLPCWLGAPSHMLQPQAAPVSV